MSISEKQLAANRRNAKLSTGPRTAFGKSVSSMNAVVHGLRAATVVIEGECPDEYNDFRNDLIVQFLPEGPLEYMLIDRIAHCAWRLKRIGRIEVEMFEYFRHPPYKKSGNQAFDFKTEFNEGRIGLAGSAMPFRSYQDALYAWYETDDGRSFQMALGGKLPNEPIFQRQGESFAADSDKAKLPNEPIFELAGQSFGRFLKGSLPPAETDEDSRSSLLDCIKRKKAEYQAMGQSNVAAALDRLLKTFQEITDLESDHQPDISALNYLLSSLLKFARKSKSFTEPLLAEVEESLDYLSGMERQIETAKNRLTLGKAVAKDLENRNVLGKLSRYETTLERSLFKNLHQLQNLQWQRKSKEETDENP